MRYRRADAKGGTYFFTVNLADRSQDLLVTHIDSLRKAFRLVRVRHPYETVAMVVLPDHLHAMSCPVFHGHIVKDALPFQTAWGLGRAGESADAQDYKITR